ncbi:MAG TPA: hypothetical protein VFZ53_04175 [Polyangiaceae bacterium]
MIVAPALLFVTEAVATAPTPAITIDPCVEVDADEVRRLAAMELRTWHWRTPPATFEVVAACRDEHDELRLTNRSLGQITVRSIDLSATGGDAKARELALAVAELLRRADMDSAPEVPSLRAKPVESAPAVQPPSPEPRPWNLELGLTGAFASWTGGEVLFGADIAGRAHWGRWVILELRLGGRKSRAVTLSNGAVDGRGAAAALGVALDAMPFVRHAGVSFGARLGADWLRYAASESGDASYDGGDATSVSVAATTTGFVDLSEALRLTADVAVGGALHSVAIREDERTVSSTRGVLLGGAVGLSTYF